MQHERVLHPVADGGRAIALKAAEFSGRGSSDDRIRLLRLATLEDARALKDNAPRPATDLPDDAFEADERRRAIVAVHHEVLDLPFPVDVAGERPGDAGSTQSWQVLALAVGFFLPALDREAGVRGPFHVCLTCAVTS